MTLSTISGIAASKARSFPLIRITLGASLFIMLLHGKAMARPSDGLDRPTLVVVHASVEFDSGREAKAGIDQQVRWFKSQHLPVVYLMHDMTPRGWSDWYTEDRVPSAAVYSVGGEHNLPLLTSDVTLVGGFFGSYDLRRGCHALALRNVVNSYFHFQKRKEPLTIHLPVSAIYFWDDDSRLRNEILRFPSEPMKWITEVSELLLNPASSSLAGQYELGQAYLMASRLALNLVKNPFGTPNVNSNGLAPAAPTTVDERNRATRRSDGLLVTPDGRYVEGPSVDTDRYMFEFIAQGQVQMTVGNGPRKVRLVFEP